MRDLRTVLAACLALILVNGTAAAQDIVYIMTLTGACKAQMIVGWDDCQAQATYSAFKNGKYTFQFVDKFNNTYALSGARNRQLDTSTMYSNIDTIVSTVDGKKAVDSQAMGGCNTKLSPD